MSRLTYFLTDFKYYLGFFLAAFMLGVIVLRFKRSKLVILLLATYYSLLAIFAFGEFYYRYIFDATDNVYNIKTTRRWIDRHVVWNSSGYRDDHFWTDKDQRETRIAFLGDSYTFGYGIKNMQDRYTELLGDQLRAKCASDKTLKTYNFGLPGNQSATYVKQLPAEVMRYQPDAIVMEYYLDDIDGDRPPELYRRPIEETIYAYKRQFILSFLLQRSYFLEYWYIRLASRLSPQHNWGELINYNETLYRDPQVWQRHLGSLQSIITSTSRAIKIPLVVFILPLSHRLGPDYPLTDIHQKLVDYFTSLDVPVLDMLPILNQYRPEQIMVSRRDFHLNELGHQLIADNLYQLVKDKPGFTCND